MHLLELCQRFAVLPPNRQSSCYLSLRIDRASELLRTRMDLTTETQNQQLMQTMSRLGHAKWRLQQTAEGLSVAAISYCLIGLSKNLAESAKAFGLINSSTLATGVAVPICATLAWLGMRRLRRQLHALDIGSDVP